MQKLDIRQTLTQRLSPQQIQFIKLLQVPITELKTRIEEELEDNPTLVEGDEQENEEEDFSDSDEEYESKDEELSEINVDDYLGNDDIDEYNVYEGGRNTEEYKEIPIPVTATLSEALLTQLSFLKLDERQSIIGKQLIGSIESDGYIRRELESIANDLFFTQNIEAEVEELEIVLKKIQTFDPPGIAAHNLQKCLLLQIDRKDEHNATVILAKKILVEYFAEFTKKHYEKIQKKLGISEQQLKDAIILITKFNPKPGGTTLSEVKAQFIVPDYILTKNNGKLELTLNSRNVPELKISRSYTEMFDTYKKSKKKDKKMKQTVAFVKQKLDAAKWFIDAIKQRQQTLLKTMNAIIQYQYDYFLSGDESKLKPMILKNISEKIDMDISTVSRVANSKYVQTEFGVLSLKSFFSESISTDSGKDVSNREVKYILNEITNNENKKKPYSDDKLAILLREKGYNIARRTVAKYRDQLKIPVGRLRKEIN